MDFGISGRRALVCGASRGLGFACATALAAEGVHVTLVARNAEVLARAASRIAETTAGQASVVVADIATPNGRAAALEVCSQPDILITNAGGPPSADFRSLGNREWSTALETNFLSAVELIRAVTDGMLQRRFGRIVNITSLTVRMPVQHLELSNATRLALTGYVAGVSRQLASQHVTVNNLLPGVMATERVQALDGTAASLLTRVPAGRAGVPEEFGAVCAFLCGVQAAYITGQNILVDGGLCPITV
jgi:3-oxoacyl-[acyl-carrier protein] reductase